MNSNEQPSTESTHDDVVDAKPKMKLWSLLIPTFVGAFVGSIVLAPIARCPGDPNGNGIAFGLGGILSLIAALTFRMLKRKSKNRS